MYPSKLFVSLLVALLAWMAVDVKARIVTGDERTSMYLPLLEGKKVALFSNHTGMARHRHVLDLLVEKGVDVKFVFSPEHGFRGTADAGEKVGSSRDERTGVEIISMYGNKRWKEDALDRGWFDVLVVDIQDVGLRFYTYYVTMCRLLDACNAHGGTVVILDRPNPNGHYVDGPILDMKYRSGVGWLPIPVVHGMTLGELALMANGEGWLEGGRKCSLTVIPCKHYTHATPVDITIPPSPNLPNLRAVLLYPSLCYFEATDVSVGRGTDFPFQVFGHPSLDGYPFQFTPESHPGAKHPLQQGKMCKGRDLRGISLKELRTKGIDLSYLIECYHALGKPQGFLSSFFEKLIGNEETRRQIESGLGIEEIRKSWQPGIEQFQRQRKPYLLYP